jgi:glycosyltransferase involved in cell wall biosynthesis
MIGFDYTMLFQHASQAGDARERHVKYAAAIRQRYPDADITIVVRVPPAVSPSPVKLASNLTVYPVRCSRWVFVGKAMQLLRYLAKQQRFDLVTTQTPFDDGWLGIWLNRRFGLPVNVQMRSSFLDLSYWIQERPIVNRALNVLGRRVASRADTIRVVSYGERRRLEKRFPVLGAKIFVLHPFVNLRVFGRPLSKGERNHTERILKHHRLSDVPFFLYVGRLAIEKNLPTALRAFSMACRNGQETALVVVGDGPLRRPLRKFARRLQLEGRVIWLDSLPLTTLRGWYALARATLLPSFHEGFGKAILESYLMDTPVIVTPFVSAEELVQDGETGLVTQSFETPKEFTEKMMCMLESPEQAKQMGRNGNRHAQDYLLSEDDYMECLVRIWRETACA